MPTDAPRSGHARRRGRPRKYGRPSEVVALTLPSETLERLGELHSDLGWAIVSLVESRSDGTRQGRRPARPAAELVNVGSGQALIVVSTDVVGLLPGVQLVPISSSQAFLALEAGKGLADLEVTVIDRLEQLPRARAERSALEGLLEQLRRWRRDPALHFQTRSIILVERQRSTARKPLK